MHNILHITTDLVNKQTISNSNGLLEFKCERYANVNVMVLGLTYYNELLITSPFTFRKIPSLQPAKQGHASFLLYKFTLSLFMCSGTSVVFFSIVVILRLLTHIKQSS